MTGLLAKAQGCFSETEIDDEIVVMHLDSGDFFALGGTARAAWRLIDGTRDRAGLIAALARDYDADEQAIEPDVDAFLAQLDEAGLVAPA